MRDIKTIIDNPRIKNVEIYNNGFYSQVNIKGVACSLVVTWGDGWEHASVAPFNQSVPTWDMMCLLKDYIWNDDEAVVQYHPRKADYVNLKKNCLHLWRPENSEMPIPEKHRVY